jgi:TrmH family RNA methyltransferase
LYGAEQINWSINNFVEIEFIFTTFKEREDTFSTISTDKIIEVSEGILKKISGTNYLIPYMAVAKINQSKIIASDFVVVLDGLQDFGNIGSIVRTNQGFSINEFMFVNMQPDPFARKVIDSSRGTVFNSKTSEYCNDESAINVLKKQGYQIIVTSPHAKNLQSQAPLQNKKIALVVGNETNGSSQKFIDSADIAVQIPMNIVVESLNASVSAGISIYELKFKQVVIMLKEKIFSNLGRQIGVTGKLIRAAFDKEIRSCTDLSGMQVILMMIMALDKTMTSEQISKDTALFGDELQEFISKIEQKNYLVNSGGNYSLTDKGTEFLAEIWPVVERTHQKILDSVSEDELTALEYSF